MLNYFGAWCYDSPSLPLVCGFLSFRQIKRAIKAHLSVASLSVSRRGRIAKKGEPCFWKLSKILACSLLRSLWRKWRWGPCLLLWLGFFECLVFLHGEEGRGPGEKGTFREWLERESRLGWSGCLAGWVSIAISLPFSLGKKLAFPKSYSGEGFSAPWANCFILGEERIGNISSNPPTVVDGGWWTA